MRELVENNVVFNAYDIMKLLSYEENYRYFHAQIRTGDNLEKIIFRLFYKLQFQ